MIITHGRAKRRMIGFACEVAATTARTRVPELIAEALAADRRAPPSGRRRRPRPPTAAPAIRRHRRAAEDRLDDGPELTVGRGVIAELVRLAAFEVPGVARVGRGGPAWRGWLGRPARSASAIRDDARRGPVAGSSPARARRSCPSPTRSGRRSAATVERLLGLDLDAVTVIVDGVGG